MSGIRRLYEQADLSEVVALDSIDLSIEPGTFVSVIGPSGCGKSTLLRLISGQERPSAGRVTVCGLSPREAAEAKAFGFVPQTPALLPWLSVLGNVTLPHRVNRRGVSSRRVKGRGDRSSGGDRVRPDLEAMLREVGLGESLHKLPAELSGGMKQRTAIVRAFGLRPDVLLLDEPFGALDEFTREALQEQLLELWEQTRATVVFVTHSISEAVRLSDKVVVMAPRPGRITEVIDIDLPRPRHQEVITSPEFHAYELALRESLRDAFSHSGVVR
ncbi:NitT/TauT family transport system ATP-binding protein [Nocardioides albertanoniae]|uniref:NitT/TauT family transport system ATP-binding protein n=2 Tax=Nocardioides albertanoniae TaxID=1175486 RepID=A0A543AB19_9ACTN|nr:NitT/TauT family transport system ATP-binding protein [Nocardioides albertanoniae]